ncbi:amidohydrolase family protein [Francisella philomiragia]|uniref:Amidohydrolase family protein n=1 Tax=Francisella philomiragia TaxID=28110 RepID=A0A0B6CQ40_9GAMM|nr:amidohydrolase family protein [Francisella philomiragia]AJI52594.1 amidohydrolase family protein [Francisella philomiragia]
MQGIIDSHIHFWDIDNNYNRWIKDTNLPTKVLPSDFKIDNFVHVEAHTEDINHLCEYKWLVDNFSNKNIKVIAFVDFTQSEQSFEQKIIELSYYKDIVGVRQIMSKDSSASYSPFDKEIPSDLFEKLVILKKYNMIFECQMYPQQFVNAVSDILKSNVTCCVEHFGLPIKTRDDNLLYWRDLLRYVDNNQNLYLKLSGGDLNNNEDKIKEILEEVKNSVASSKLCYGSNYPVSNTDNYNKWFDMVCNAFIDAKSQQDIFFNTANKLYKFNL